MESGSSEGVATQTVFETFEGNAAQEREARRPLMGPHRDDLEVLWAGRGARGVLSAGERKAFGLVLLAARGGVLTGQDREPVYLLDDADTELDRTRLKEVWSLFEGVGQVFASSNREAVWEGLDVSRKWLLEAGEPRVVDGPEEDLETST